MDTLVLDIETKNTFVDVGGRQNMLQMLISVVCVYSYQKNEYLIFDETRFEDLKKLLSVPAVIVGFSSNKFDIPLLNHHLGLTLNEYPRVDLSDEIEQRTGRMIGLGALAKLNLGKDKKGVNVGAKDLYNAGKFEELYEYCRHDVELTKELYDGVQKNGYILIPNTAKTGVKKVSIQFPDSGKSW